MGSTPRQYRVFISSTYLDNIERRRRVEEAVLRAGMLPVGMERFAASPQPAPETCVELAAEADLLLGIVAWRYGWEPEGRERSITELEYDAARERLMFVIDDRARVNPAVDFDPGPDRALKFVKLERFKAKIDKDVMAVRFTDLADLVGKVSHSLHNWRAERERSPEPASDPTPAESAGPASFDEELAAYLNHVEALHATLPLAGFETRLRVPIQLEDLYVPLDAVVDMRAAGCGGFGDAAEAAKALSQCGEGRDWPLSEAFRRARQYGERRGLVLLGDPGSGKTTHLKRALLWLVRRPAETLGLPPGTVPVLLPLRKVGDIGEGFEALLEQEIDSPHLRLPTGFAGRLLRRGRLLFLLDGLDEVASGRDRAEVARWVEAAMTGYPDSCFLVTCRYAGYTSEVQLDSRFLELHLKPLSSVQADTFIHNWYRIVETSLEANRERGELRAREGAAELVEHLRQPDFRARRVFELTRNPLLLTAICLVHRDRGRLPNRRADLYEECVNVLLGRWREAKKLPVSMGARQARQVLQPVALWLHGHEGRTQATAEELSKTLGPALEAVRWEGGSPEAFLETIRDESGLVTGHSNRMWGFMHLGFQEYLAAREVRGRLVGDSGPLSELAAHFGESWWREVTLLLLALEDRTIFEALMREVVKQPGFAKHPDLVAECLDDALQVSAAPFRELLECRPGNDRELWARQLAALRVLEKLDRAGVAALSKRLTRHPMREIAERFSPRVLLGTQVTERGGVELVRIPAGSFLMGSADDEAERYDDEGPIREVAVSAFLLGRTPVTNAQYGSYMESNPGLRAPMYWSHRQYNQPNQPVVGVSWHEAVAFSEWTGGRLPTEAEWEYACRAGTTTRYWSGDAEEDLARVGWFDANSEGLLHAVGEKPPNPWGLHDMHGNVWEWCQDRWQDHYDDGFQQDPTGPRSGGCRVFRGGGFRGSADVCRSAYRDKLDPTERLRVQGFRVVLPAASSS